MHMITYGGVCGATVKSLVDEINHGLQDISLSFVQTPGDPLLYRHRSQVLDYLYRETDADVFVNIDRDIVWRRGDVCALAKKAVELQALVGGLYCKRVKGNGWSARLKSRELDVCIPSETCLPAEYLGAGFLAIPRSAVERIIAEKEASKLVLYHGTSRLYWGFYHPLEAPHPEIPNAVEDLGDDWSFCARARLAGIESYVYARPVLEHIGEHYYTITDGIPAKSLA